MNGELPATETVRLRLSGLAHADIRQLAARSGVPFTTLWKIRSGETTNPGLDTVRRFWPELIGTAGAPPIQQEARDAA